MRREEGIDLVIDAVIPISTLARRLPGGREWRVEIEAVLALVRGQMQAIRKIRDKFPNDASVQSWAADALENLAEQVIRLTMLYHYKPGDSETNGHAISGGQANGEGGQP